MSPAAERWSAILARAEKSELSLRAFARSEGYNPNTLAWWRWNLRRQEEAHQPDLRLAEVVLVEEESSVAADELTVRVRDADIVVRADSDLDLLRRVVEALS
jgi:hypothetical protein